MTSKQDSINSIIEKYGGADKRIDITKTINRSKEISNIINTCKDKKEKEFLKKMYKSSMTDYHSN
jgi:hypothetical protein